MRVSSGDLRPFESCSPLPTNTLEAINRQPAVGTGSGPAEVVDRPFAPAQPPSGSARDRPGYPGFGLADRYQDARTPGQARRYGCRQGIAGSMHVAGSHPAARERVGLDPVREDVDRSLPFDAALRSPGSGSGWNGLGPEPQIAAGSRCGSAGQQAGRPRDGSGWPGSRRVSAPPGRRRSSPRRPGHSRSGRPGPDPPPGSGAYGRGRRPAGRPPPNRADRSWTASGGRSASKAFTWAAISPIATGSAAFTPLVFLGGDRGNHGGGGRRHGPRAS